MTVDTETTRQCLMDSVVSQRKGGGKAPIMSRVTYIAKLSQRQNNATPLQGLYDELLARFASQDVGINGVVVVYSWYLVHTFETKSSAVMPVLRAIHSLDTATGSFQGTKVLSIVEDVQIRAFNQCFTAFADVPCNQQAADAPDPSVVATVIYELVTAMKTVGKTLGSATEMELRAALRSLQSYCEDVPLPQSILSLLMVEEAMPLDDFIDVFDTPMNIDLDSESVWPTPAAVKCL